MGLKERRVREKSARKKLIMNAAMELIRASGVESLTMRKLADLIEYSPCVVYETFPNKTALISDLFSVVCEELLGEMRAVTRGKRPEIYFRNLIVKDIEFMTKEAYRVQLFIAVSMETPPGEFPASMQEVIQLIGKGLQQLGYPKLSTMQQLEEAQDVLRTFLAGLLQQCILQKSKAGLDRCNRILENGLTTLLDGWRQ